MATGGVLLRPHGRRQMHLLKFGVDLTSKFTIVNVDFGDLCSGEFVGILRLSIGEGVPAKGTLMLK